MPDTALENDFWMHDVAILHQWNNVLKFKPGQEVVLFDGKSTDRLYELAELSKTEAHLKLITELKRRLPAKHSYLFFCLLKRDNTEHILQKATELGATNLIPIISERTIKKDFNIARAEKIVIEASEQCGRSDIPNLRSPIKLPTAIEEYENRLKLLVCDTDGKVIALDIKKDVKPVGVFVGPEGGWTEAERRLFKSKNIESFSLGDMVLRGETAAITAIAKLV